MTEAIFTNASREILDCPRCGSAPTAMDYDAVFGQWNCTDCGRVVIRWFRDVNPGEAQK